MSPYLVDYARNITLAQFRIVVAIRTGWLRTWTLKKQMGGRHCLHSRCDAWLSSAPSGCRSEDPHVLPPFPAQCRPAR